MSRAQRYALGAAMALTFAGTACKTEEAPPVEPESAENATASADPPAPPELPKRPSPPEDRAREAPPPPSPFLVGAPPSDPPLPQLPERVDAAPVDAGVADAGKTIVRKPPPPPPPPPPLDDDPKGWKPHRQCVRNSNGQMVCPPYGCVFPDEACDILRV